MNLRRPIGIGCTVLLSLCLFSSLGAQAAAYKAVETSIEVTCLQVNAASAHHYEIAIEALSWDAPLPGADTLRIAEDGTGSFDITITEPGTFVYRIYEKPGTDSSFLYDDTVYHVTVFVEVAEAEDLLYAVSVTREDTGEKPEQVSFQDIVLGDRDTVSTTVPVWTDDVWTDSLETTGPSASTDVTEPQTSVTSTTTTTITETVTETTTDSVSPPPSGVVDYINSVLTGDRSPIGLVAGVMLAAGLIGGTAFLLRRRSGSDDQDNPPES